MCGIAGFIGFENNIDLAINSNIIQKHRGPDNQSIWNDDYIALSHQRLSIIDLTEKSNQPFIKNNLVICFNGEIYNFKELKNDHLKDIKFETESDTEVVLELFMKFSENSFNLLRGMFAFSIYNIVSKELIIVRDHFGIKPLFYYHKNNNFAFSSELKTLTKIPNFNKTLNKKAIVSAVNYLWISGNESIFECVKKIPTGSYLKVKENLIEIHKYYDFDINIDSITSEEDQIIKLKNTIENSINSHLISDVPISTFLSGGLDSSLITIIAQKKIKDLQTYTITTSDSDKKIEQMPDDEKYADLISDKYNIKNEKIEINPSIIDELKNIVKFLDEPIGDPAAINTYLMCLQASKNNNKVVLSGMGADEIFGGYRRHNATLIAFKFNKLPIFLKKTIRLIINILPVKIGKYGFKIGRWAKRFIKFTDLPESETYMSSYSYYTKKDLFNLLKPDYFSGVDEIYEEHNNIFNHSKTKGFDIINKMCYTDINLFMLGLNITYSDRASMAASVELRVPFIDKEVIENAFAIPGKLKIKKKTSKYILKKVAENFLDKEIIYRKKASFGAPIRSWISNDLKEIVNDLLSEKNINKRGVFNYSFIKKLIDNDSKGIEDNAYQIYQLLTIELWFREYLD
jgi:asparagine synthase (glutamine-hydrolysing)